MGLFSSSDNKPDKQMQAVLDELEAFHALPLENTTPEVGRQLPTLTNAVMAVLSKHKLPTGSTGW